jgi:phosphohistidine swiveling domain-containing protein
MNPIATSEPRVFAFTDPLAAEHAISGGKGANLARAAQHLPVPPGVVVGSAAYRAFVAPLQEAIRSVLDDAALDHATRSAHIQSMLLAHSLPADLHDELASMMRDAGLLDTPVAVRSSGTLEDLPGAAFAGQHDTLLGIRGVDAVVEAIRRCYASLWNAHVLPYRERLGLDHLDAAMAVVVQKMVQVGEHESAGVAFSIDPVRGALDQVLINAAFGLGETVVGGDEPVDEYRLQRSDFSEVETVIAEKLHALVTDPASGTRRIAVSGGRPMMPALDPAQRQAVAKLALAAETHFGFPQDIEWAFQDGRLYLLQSRAVTRIPPRWTRDESAERFPMPVTPLTWDLCEAGFHASLNHSFRLMGLPPFGDKWFAMRDYYIYGNQNAVQLYSGRTPTKMLKDVDSIRAALPQIARQFAWVQELPVRWMRDLDNYLIGIGALMREPLDGLPLNRLWDYVLRINALGASYFLPNIAISLTQRTLYVGLQQMLRLALPDDQAQSVFDQLLAVTDTKTGQVNAELWSLSRLLRMDAPLHQRLLEAPSVDLLPALADHPVFHAEFQRFLARHGHRELDFDAYHPTWIEAPHIVLDQLKMLVDRPDEDRAAAERRQKAAQAAMEHTVLAHAPEELRYLVHEVIRLARTYTALDDLEHYQTTRLHLPFRRGLKAIGMQLVERGVLGDPMDVYFVPLAVLDAAMHSGDLSPLAAAAALHKAGYLAACKCTPDWIFGEAEPIDLDGSDVLKGLGGSPGIVEGEVFVVRSPEDFPHFPKQAILVARTTNPAWTPLFYQAIGVITESGGPLSHGAVTARELGLPAVMSVRHVMRLLVNGQRVRIDGRNGIVQIL